MKNNRSLLLMTFMSLFLFGTSLYGQQEVDPTWYNPWSVPNKVVAHPSQPQLAKHKNQPKIVSAVPKRQPGKFGTRQFVTRQAQSQFADGTFSAGAK